MKIAVISDTHGNSATLKVVLETIKSESIEVVLHCGDIGSPDIIGLMKDFNAYFALGNMDSDYAAYRNRTRKMSEGDDHTSRFTGTVTNAVRVAPFHEMNFDGVPLAFCHGHTPVLDQLITGGEFNFVCHGHTHRRRDETLADNGLHKDRSKNERSDEPMVAGTTRIINPGALGGGRSESRSFCIIDLSPNQVAFYEVPESGRHPTPRRIKGPAQT